MLHRRWVMCCAVLCSVGWMAFFAGACSRDDTSERSAQDDAASREFDGEPTQDRGLEPGADRGLSEPVRESAEPVSTPDAAVSPEQKPEDKRPLPRPQSGWCAQARGGPASKTVFALSFSALHAKYRFFGTHKGTPLADLALTRALAAEGFGSYALLQAYAKEIVDACALSAEVTTMGPAKIVSKDGVAWIVPGTGQIRVPSGSRGVVLDLRSLTAHPALKSVLKAALSASIGRSFRFSSTALRFHKGMYDEYFSPRNSFGNHRLLKTAPAVAGQLQKDLPLVVVVGDTMPPAVANFAADLRLQRRAWLAGPAINTRLAESAWVGIKEAGVLLRVMKMWQGQQAWPDLIPADAPAVALETKLKVWLSKPEVVALAPGKDTRAGISPIQAYRQVSSRTLARHDVLAALLVAHGALRLFFPYFKVVGDTIDDRLLEVLRALDGGLSPPPVTPKLATSLLRRFGEAIKDGHNFISFFGRNPEVVGYFPMELDFLGAKAVVRRSALPSLKVGDVIEKIGDTPFATWLQKQYRMTSAATEGYRFTLATNQLLYAKGPTSFTLRDPDGKQRVVTAKPQTAEAYRQHTQAAKVTLPRFLKQEGAPDIFYINLASQNFPTILTVSRAMTALSKAKGLVLDMRGYPGPSSWEVIRRMVKGPLSSPFFRQYHWTGHDERVFHEFQQTLPAMSDPLYSGPIVVLVGPSSVSQAEHLITMLLDAKRVMKVVGRRSAGTNGTITYLMLPGLLSFSFTGQEVRHIDKRTFHGKGIVPDVVVEPTPKDLRDGYDRVLRTAIQQFKTAP